MGTYKYSLQIYISQNIWYYLWYYFTLHYSFTVQVHYKGFSPPLLLLLCLDACLVYLNVCCQGVWCGHPDCDSVRHCKAAGQKQQLWWQKELLCGFRTGRLGEQILLLDRKEFSPVAWVHCSGLQKVQVVQINRSCYTSPFTKTSMSLSDLTSW